MNKYRVMYEETDPLNGGIDEYTSFEDAEDAIASDIERVKYNLDGDVFVEENDGIITASNGIEWARWTRLWEKPETEMTKEEMLAVFDAMQHCIKLNGVEYPEFTIGRISLAVHYVLNRNKSVQ